MAGFSDFMKGLLPAGSADVSPAPDPMAGVPTGHVNAGGVHVPRGAPQPGQLGTPSNPLSAAQMKTIMAPNSMQYSGLQPKAGDSDILGMMKFMALNGGFGGQSAPQPMSNFDYAQKHGSTDIRAPSAFAGGNNTFFGSNMDSRDILANILNG